MLRNKESAPNDCVSSRALSKGATSYIFACRALCPRAHINAPESQLICDTGFGRRVHFHAMEMRLIYRTANLFAGIALLLNDTIYAAPQGTIGVAKEAKD